MSTFTAPPSASASADSLPVPHHAGRGLRGPDRIVLDERPIPACGLNDAIVQVTMTTICGTDVHILRGRVSGRARAHRRP